jgi:hypothetical protein
MRSVRAMAIVAAMTLAACDTPKTAEPTPSPSAAQGAAVRAERVTNGVRITNDANAAIKYAVVNPMWLGQIASCRVNDCPTVAAGSAVVVPESAIHGFSASAPTLVVYYWLETTSVWEPVAIEISN